MTLLYFREGSGIPDDFLIHLIQRAGDFLGHLLHLEALHHLLDFRQRAAISSRYGLAERNRLANHLEIGSARPAILLARGRFSATLWTVHDSSVVSGCVRLLRKLNLSVRKALSSSLPVW